MRTGGRGEEWSTLRMRAGGRDKEDKKDMENPGDNCHGQEQAYKGIVVEPFLSGA
jgi:hypothetical protein